MIKPASIFDKHKIQYNTNVLKPFFVDLLFWWASPISFMTCSLVLNFCLTYHQSHFHCLTGWNLQICTLFHIFWLHLFYSATWPTLFWLDLFLLTWPGFLWLDLLFPGLTYLFQLELFYPDLTYFFPGLTCLILPIFHCMTHLFCTDLLCFLPFPGLNHFVPAKTNLCCFDLFFLVFSPKLLFELTYLFWYPFLHS